MTRWRVAAILLAATVLAAPRTMAQAGVEASGLSGRWALDRAASQFPTEVGFSAEWLSTGVPGGDSSEGGRGRRGSGGSGGNAGAFPMPNMSQDDAKRVQQLTAEVRTPAARLTIVETVDAVTITADGGTPRSFHPNSRDEILQLDGVPVTVLARRDAGRLLVTYKVDKGRELRYTYARDASARLTVDTQFVERGTGEVVKRVYGPASTTDPEPAPRAASQTPVGPPAPRRGDEALPGAPTEPFNQKPDAELKGLTKLGLVVEGLTGQAASCGLSEDMIESALASRLTTAGFKVIRDSDEDSYVYVNIMTTSLPTGLCVSRYDVTFYTHTTARLTYQQTPVLVQVSLLHKGGLSGGAAATHGAGVLRGVQEYLDQFVTRIHDANK